MNHSEKVGALAGAFLRAQATMGDIIKTAENPHFKSKYAALPAVVEAIVPALAAQGIAVMQGGSTALTTMLIHAESGEWLETTFDLILPADPQKACAGNTYARRYALLGVVCAAAEDDDGNKAAGRGRKPIEQPDIPEESLNDRAKRLGVTDLRGKCVERGLPFNQDSVRVILEDYERVAAGAWKFSAAQRKLLMAMHAKAGHDDIARLDFYRSTIGRTDIMSSTDLTRGEFDQVVKALEAVIA